jgi:hypothetical protein
MALVDSLGIDGLTLVAEALLGETPTLRTHASLCLFAATCRAAREAAFAAQPFCKAGIGPAGETVWESTLGCGSLLAELSLRLKPNSLEPEWTFRVLSEPFRYETRFGGGSASLALGAPAACFEAIEVWRSEARGLPVPRRLVHSWSSDSFSPSKVVTESEDGAVLKVEMSYVPLEGGEDGLCRVNPRSVCIELNFLNCPLLQRKARQAGWRDRDHILFEFPVEVAETAGFSLTDVAVTAASAARTPMSGLEPRRQKRKSAPQVFSTTLSEEDLEARRQQKRRARAAVKQAVREWSRAEDFDTRRNCMLPAHHPPPPPAPPAPPPQRGALETALRELRGVGGGRRRVGAHVVQVVRLGKTTDWLVSSCVTGNVVATSLAQLRKIEA